MLEHTPGKTCGPMERQVHTGEGVAGLVTLGRTHAGEGKSVRSASPEGSSRDKLTATSTPCPSVLLGREEVEKTGNGVEPRKKERMGSCFKNW